MAEVVNRADIEKYLSSVPTDWGNGFKGLSLIAGLACLITMQLVLMLFGVALIVLSSYLKMGEFTRITDSAFDKFLEKELSGLMEQSLSKSSLDESELVAESVVITGPRFRDQGGATVLSRQGDDGKLRFTPINVNVLHMTQNQLVSFECCFDLTTGNFLNESSHDFFYSDIVSVETKTISESVVSEKFGKLQLDRAEVFVLTTSAGTKMKTILKDPKLLKKMGGGEISTDGAIKAVQVVRKMLREKKAA